MKIIKFVFNFYCMDMSWNITFNLHLPTLKSENLFNFPSHSNQSQYRCPRSHHHHDCCSNDFLMSYFSSFITGDSAADSCAFLLSFLYKVPAADPIPLTCSISPGLRDAACLLWCRSTCSSVYFISDTLAAGCRDEVISGSIPLARLLVQLCSFIRKQLSLFL